MGKGDRKKKTSALKRGTNVQAKPTSMVSVSDAPWGGDHGTGTLAAKSGTKLVELKNDDGSNPNRIKRRERIDQIEKMKERLSMRQYQAAKAIADAYCKVQMLSSGAELKEQVDASPKPDAVVAVQVSAMSRLKTVMEAVPSTMRDVIEHVCWHNQAIHRMTGSGRKHYNRTADFKVALDLVANRLGY